MIVDLRKAMVDYLSLRRSLGFELQWAEERISSFLDHLDLAGSPVITTALAVEWATLPRGTTTEWWAHRLNYVRGFARYAHSLDPRHEVPPTDVIPVSSHRKPVYLYSEADVMALMATAQKLKEPLRALTYSTLIGLLAVTGMRVGLFRVGRSRLVIDLSGAPQVVWTSYDTGIGRVYRWSGATVTPTFTVSGGSVAQVTPGCTSTTCGDQFFPAIASDGSVSYSQSNWETTTTASYDAYLNGLQVSTASSLPDNDAFFNGQFIGDYNGAIPGHPIWTDIRGSDPSYSGWEMDAMTYQ